MTIHENDYVDQAEQAIKKLSAKKDQKALVTTSKIRNLLAMVSDIYNDVRNVQGEV